MAVTEDRVRASIATARTHLEAAAEQIIWQVENEVWTVLGYDSWDAMREAEYGGAACMVPSGSRPRIVGRLRELGLKQREIAATVGVSVGTVNGDLKFSSEHDTTITNARGQQRPASYAKRDKKLSDLPPDQRAHAEADRINLFRQLAREAFTREHLEELTPRALSILLDDLADYITIIKEVLD